MLKINCEMELSVSGEAQRKMNNNIDSWFFLKSASVMLQAVFWKHLPAQHQVFVFTQMERGNLLRASLIITLYANGQVLIHILSIFAENVFCRELSYFNQSDFNSFN